MALAIRSADILRGAHHAFKRTTNGAGREGLFKPRDVGITGRSILVAHACHEGEGNVTGGESIRDLESPLPPQPYVDDRTIHVRRADDVERVIDALRHPNEVASALATSETRCAAMR